MTDFDFSTAQPTNSQQSGFDFSTAQPTKGMAPVNHSNIVNNATAHNFAPFQLPQFRSAIQPDPGQGGVFGTSAGAPSAPDPMNKVQAGALSSGWSDEEKQMAAQGIDIASGAPYRLRNQLSMLVRPKDDEINRVVTQYFGKDVGLTRNQYGELQYNDPKTGRPTLLESHMTYGTPTGGGALDQTLVGGGSLAAGLVAGAVTKSVPMTQAAVSAGAAIGQAASDGIKAFVRKMFNIGGPENVQDQAGRIGTNAAITGGVTAAGSIIAGIPAATRWMLEHSTKVHLSYGEAQTLLDQAKVGLQKIQPFLDKIGLTGFQPSATELAPELPAMKSMYDRAVRGTDESAAAETLRVNSNLDALGNAYQAEADAYNIDGYTFGSSGQNVKDQMLAIKNARAQSLQLQKEMAQQDAQRVAQGLPPLTEQERDEKLTEMLNVAKNAAKNSRDDAYGDLKVKLGVPAAVAYERGPEQYFQQQQLNKQMPVTKETHMLMQGIWQKGANLNEGGLAATSGDKYWAAIPDKFFKDVNHPELGLHDINDMPNTDILSVIDNIQDIRSGWRNSVRISKGQVPADEQAAGQVSQILEKNVYDYFRTNGDPSVLDAWERAQQAHIDYEQQFNRGILRQAMTTEGGFPSPVYAQVSARTLMNSGAGKSQEAIKQLYTAIKSDPNAIQDARGVVWSILKDPAMGYVDASGIPTAKGWTKFKSDMEGPIKYLFGDGDVTKINTMDDFVGKLAETDKALKGFNAAWRADPEFGGLPTSAGQITDAVFKDRSVSPQALVRMVNLLKTQYPDLLRQLQTDTAQKFRLLTSDRNGTPVPDAINRALDPAKWGQRLNIVMGPDYVKNMKLMQTVASVGTRGAAEHVEPDTPQSVFTQLVRTFFAPPLSREGRFYSGVLAFRDRAAARIIQNAMSSPDNLQKFIDAGINNTRMPVLGGLLAQWNGASYLSSRQANEVPPPQKNLQSPQ